MKGLIPWLREMVFGSEPVKLEGRRCVECIAYHDERCASGYCWQHHYKSCCVQNAWTGEIILTCREREPDGELAELRKMIHVKGGESL